MGGDRVARIVSYLFHPLWIPVLLFICITSFDAYYIPNPQIRIFVVILLIINVVAPGLSIMILRWKKIIGDMELSNPKERLTPFLIVIVYFGFTYYLLRSKGILLPDSLLAMLSGMLVSLVLSLFITLYWKISIHALAIGGGCGALFALLQLNGVIPLSVVLFAGLIAGWVGWARIQLGLHTHAQIYAGFLLGVIIQVLFIHQHWYF